ncbi:MAG: RNA polymerase factor sigma-54 [Planctomycetes bacterium]|nr:RNA polymerase factor sigma-54 [Planctomycetota bacterium]
MEHRLQLQQKLVLAPMIIQSIEILQLPQMNLLEYVEQQLQENEALDVEQQEAPEQVKMTEREKRKGETPAPTEHEKLMEFVQPEFVPEDWEEFRYARTGNGDDRDKKQEALNNTPGRESSLQDRVAEQLQLVEADPRVHDLAQILAYSLNHRGFLAPHRFVRALLAATDATGALQKPLAEVVASVDGIAAVKIPQAKPGVTPEEISAARDARDRVMQEAQQVLATIEQIRLAPGGAEMSLHDIELRYPLVECLLREKGDWSIEEAEAALRLLQTLEPKGIAGRTEEETLVLQIDPDDLLYVEKRKLIECHLEDMEKNRLQKIAKAMDLTLDDIQMLLEEMKDLDPSPGSRLAPESAALVYPDVIVNEVDGHWTVDLVNSQIPTLVVREDFVQLMNDKDAPTAQREMARKRVEGARWLIDAIQQRQSTLTRVAERIFAHQQAYLAHGESALRPLKMQTVADELSIHVSTVSRAIADKWVQTPQGINALKYFFTGGTETESGDVESRLNVKNRVKEIVDGEDPANPLSDDDVAARLKDHGLDIARRTVTKYRKQLGIASSRQRRKW